MEKVTYDEISDWYADLRNDNALSLVDNLIYPYLFKLLETKKHPFICDLGCGQGKLTRIIAKKGIKVLGVDNSRKLLDIAIDREKKEPLGISYLQDNAETLLEINNDQFDGVICHMALMDISNLNSTFDSVSRILKKDGWFAFSITHPCFDSPNAEWAESSEGKLKREIFEYFNEGFWKSKNTTGIRGQVGAYHRKLSTYFDSLINTGLTFEQLIEPEATSIEIEHVPGYKIIPIFLIIIARK